MKPGDFIIFVNFMEKRRFRKDKLRLEGDYS
jgi:hypothetical protein